MPMSTIQAKRIINNLKLSRTLLILFLPTQTTPITVVSNSNLLLCIIRTTNPKNQNTHILLNSPHIISSNSNIPSSSCHILVSKCQIIGEISKKMKTKSKCPNYSTKLIFSMDSPKWCLNRWISRWWMKGSMLNRWWEKDIWNRRKKELNPKLKRK